MHRSAVQPPDHQEASTRRETEGPRPKAVLVGIRLPQRSEEEFEASLTELTRLADTLGLQVVARVTQRRDTLSASTGLGEGKLRELASWTAGPGYLSGHIKPGTEVEDEQEWPSPVPEDQRATVVLVDHDLSPRQARNLELATGVEVLDRSMVVVSIFQRHARTREARLQVEIARLTYMAPRLRESGAGEDRQRGGVGGKGAGETSMELNRRQIRDRIAELKRELEVAMRTADTQRSRRAASQTVAIVGYTNAGKSSLMRRLTGDSVYVADQLFATLDTTVRVLKPETRPRILVSDTVGFIKDLPHDLVASFRSTLQEAEEASLLLHLVDGADPAFREQLQVTQTVLSEIGADKGERLLVLNKSDKLTPEQRTALQEEFPDALLMSARDADDVGALHARLVAFFERDMEDETFFVPYSRQALVATMHDQTHVLEEKHDETGTRITVRAPGATMVTLRREIGPQS